MSAAVLIAVEVTIIVYYLVIQNKKEYNMRGIAFTETSAAPE